MSDAAFTARDVCRITGISLPLLKYLHRRGFRAALPGKTGRGGGHRYSMADIERVNTYLSHRAEYKPAHLIVSETR